MSASLPQQDTTVTEGEGLLPVGQRVWTALPTLLLIDLALVVSALPSLLLLAAGFPIVALGAAVIFVGPVWAGTVALADRINNHDHVSMLTLLRLVRQHAKAGITVSAVPAVVAIALMSSVSVWAANPDTGWLIVPVLLNSSLAIIVTLCCVSVFSLAASGLRGWSLWRASLAVCAISPVTTVGSIVLFAVIAWLLVQVAPVLLPVILAPVAVVFSAVTWWAVQRLSVIPPNARD